MRKSPNDHKQALIHELTIARESILEAVRKVPEEQFDASCIGTWSVKDLVAHLIGWDFTNLKAVQEILAGQRPSFFQYYDADWASYNARLVGIYRIEPFEALMAKAADSHRLFVNYLQTLATDDVMHGKSPKELGRSVTIRNLLRAEAEDERKHCLQVQEFLEKVRPEKNNE